MRGASFIFKWNQLSCISTSAPFTLGLKCDSFRAVWLDDSHQ